jgi:hypothetical protein
LGPELKQCCRTTYQVGDHDLGLAVARGSSGRSRSDLGLLGLLSRLVHTSDRRVGGSRTASTATSVAATTAGALAAGLKNVVERLVKLSGRHVDRYEVDVGDLVCRVWRGQVIAVSRRCSEQVGA